MSKRKPANAILRQHNINRLVEIGRTLSLCLLKLLVLSEEQSEEWWQQFDALMNEACDHTFLARERRLKSNDLSSSLFHLDSHAALHFLLYEMAGHSHDYPFVIPSRGMLLVQLKAIYDELTLLILRDGYVAYWREEMVRILDPLSDTGMVIISSDHTGLLGDIFVFASNEGAIPCTPRIKISNTRGKTNYFNNTFSVSISRHPAIIDGDGEPRNFSTSELDAIYAWVSLNRDPLLRYWSRHVFSTREFLDLL